MANICELSVENIKEILSKLSHSLKAGYGPAFQHTIISTSAGRILITNDGIQIIKVFDIKHPVANFIVSAVVSHNRSCGDDSKTFIILLNELLIKTEGVVACTLTNKRIQMSRDFRFVLNEVMPTLFLTMDKYCSRTYIPTCMDSPIAVLYSLLLGSMNTHLLEYDAALLSSLLAQMLKSWCAMKRHTSVKSTVAMLTENEEQLFIENPGMSLSTSSLYAGCLISRGFCHIDTNLKATLCGSNQIKFTLLSCGIGPNEEDHTAHLNIAGKHASTGLYDILDYEYVRVKAVMDNIKKQGISLLITRVELSELEKKQCSQYGVAAIHTVPEEELTFLSAMFCVDIIYDLSELSASNHGTLRKCEEIVMNSQTFVGLQPLVTAPICSLVIAGPTAAISRQARLLMKASLRVVQSALTSKESPWYESSTRTSDGESGETCVTSNGRSPQQISPVSLASATYEPESAGCTTSEMTSEYLYTIAAGGTFELALHTVINNYLSTQPAGARGTTALTALKESLLSIPQLLHTNAYCIAKPRWLKTLEATREVVKNGHTIGVDAIYGTAVKSSMMHSVSNKHQLIVNVLNTLCQLLCLDHVM